MDVRGAATADEDLMETGGEWNKDREKTGWIKGEEDGGEGR